MQAMVASLLTYRPSRDSKNPVCSAVPAQPVAVTRLCACLWNRNVGTGKLMRRQSLQHFKAPPHEISADHETERHFDKLDDQLGSAHLVAGIVAHVSLQCPLVVAPACCKRLSPIAWSSRHLDNMSMAASASARTLARKPHGSAIAHFERICAIRVNGSRAILERTFRRHTFEVDTGRASRQMKAACDERTTADTGYGSGGTSRRHRRCRRQDSA
jgi:hypothetical protein